MKNLSVLIQLKAIAKQNRRGEETSEKRGGLG